MGSIISKISGMLSVNTSSTLGALSDFDYLIKTIFARFGEIWSWLYGGIVDIVYFVFKFVLTVIDLCFVLLRQLIGINTDFSSFDNIIENDVVFEFIFSDNVITIMRAMLGLAIVVIIVFGIIAIIKSEFNAVSDPNNKGEILNDKGKVWKNILESCLLLILVPIVLFGSIILSNAVLSGLYNATSNGLDVSVGGQIFVASTYSANAYREYANNNIKYPITYSFNKVKDYDSLTSVDTTGGIADIEASVNSMKSQSAWVQGLATYYMFYLGETFSMTDVDYMQSLAKNNAYNNIYDANIYTYRYEYYVNADLIDYMMLNNTKIYVMTLEEAYNSCQSAGVNTTITKSCSYYNLSVNYADSLDPIEYKHTTHTSDESNGAVFVACIAQTKETGSGSIRYFEPITGKNSNFSSTYLKDNNQCVVLRGLFDDGIYPTAIKKLGDTVYYYRDEVQVPSFLSFLPHISYELPAGTTQLGSQYVISKAIEIMSGVDIMEFIPYIYLDIDITHLFTKGTYTICSFNSGFYLDYNFTQSKAKLELFYDKININIVILILASIIILGRVFYALFGAVRRFVDLMFLYIMYPAAVSTIPLYGKSSLTNWIKQVASKLFSAYGIVIGLNLGLALVSISDSITFVTDDMISMSVFSSLPSGYTADFINRIVQLLFSLVGINFIFHIGKVISFLFFDENAKKADDAKDLSDEGKETVKGSIDVYKTAGKYISGKFLLDAVEDIKKFVPGSAIKNEIEGRINQHKTNELLDQQMEAQMRDAQNNLEPPSDSGSGSGSGGGSGGSGSGSGGSGSGGGSGGSGGSSGGGSGGGSGSGSGGGSGGSGSGSGSGGSSS